LRHVGFPVSPRDYRGLTASAFSLPWRSASVVEQNHQVVGFADLYQIVPGASAFIGNLIIGREARGQGAGRALIEYMTQQAANRHRVREIRLSVFNGNTPALMLYARMQFTPYALEERIDWGGQPVILIHMKKPIHAR
ncbi:MAG: GNAT family N-acetyltransferase, partial [Candidatus Thiodiazotropha sp.]